MKKIILAGVAAVALLGSSAVYAQHHWDGEGGWRGEHGWRHHARLSPEDRLALVDARIAAVKAGLKLTADQEKNWPAVETAVRDFAKERIAGANAAAPDESDPVARLRTRADRMAATAAGLKRIADAADPLYKTLDEGQKRRLAVLTHMEGRHGFFGMGRGMGPGRGMGHMDREGGDSGPGRGGPGMLERDGGGRL